MPTLDYAPPTARHRRYWLLAATLLAITLSSAWAMPNFRSYQARQQRRAAIRAQFASQLAKANSLLDQKKEADAAVLLFRGELPTHTESQLFWQWELDSFNRRAEKVRQRIEAIHSTVQTVARDRERRIEDERESQARESTRNTVINYENLTAERIQRQSTLRALEFRARDRLWEGNVRQAMAICEQIITLDPPHRFNDNFWTNLRNAPPIPRRRSQISDQNSLPPP